MPGERGDDERFTRLIRWFAEKELEYEPGSPEEKLQVAAAEAAAYLGIEDDHPAMRRIRAMCRLDHLGVSISGSERAAGSSASIQTSGDSGTCRSSPIARIRQEWIDEGAPESARGGRRSRTGREADALRRLPTPVTEPRPA